MADDDLAAFDKLFERVCSKCKVRKSCDAFRLALKRGVPTQRTRCIECERAYNREYRSKNLEIVKARFSNWYYNKWRAANPKLEPRETEAGRKCTKCKKRLPDSAFGKMTRGGKRLHIYCKDCVNANGRERRDAECYKQFGVTRSELEAILKRTDNGCEICGRKIDLDLYEKHNNGQLYKACLDHNHGTGKFRGLLCAPCNSGIGMLGDNKDTVMRAAMYLAKHNVD